MKVFFAPAAKLELLSIGEHIGQENPTRAIRAQWERSYNLRPFRRISVLDSFQGDLR
jgi:plasmid stabilization system protein ParE